MSNGNKEEHTNLRDAEMGRRPTRTFCFATDRNRTYLLRYLNWSFEASFPLYFLSAVVGYCIMIIAFAVLIVLSVTKGNTCIEGISVEKTLSNNFASAFTLSWTTFSTVGYGQTYPNLDRECALANTVTSLESFIGILYAGFCGAILFGKVLTVYSRASVIFSKVCVIRYGAGVTDDLDDDTDTFDNIGDLTKSDSGIFADTNGTCAPFPILLFRIVNEKANHKYGNIVNLNLNVVSVVEVSDPNDTNENGNDGAIRRRFRKLHLTPESPLPIFDKIVYAKHVLNTTSPLLKAETRSLINANNGKWPSSINTAEKIRDSIHFAQIIFALDGISNISKTTVYAQKTYSMEDLKVGWRFRNMTFHMKTEAGSELPYHVDLDLVDAVKEQKGGGGENLEN